MASDMQTSGSSTALLQSSRRTDDCSQADSGEKKLLFHAAPDAAGSLCLPHAVQAKVLRRSMETGDKYLKFSPPRRS